jgi:hypothetical protein
VITDIEQACDRLIVLGKGHTLLDLTIAEALAHHRVVEAASLPAASLPATEAGDVVGRFPAPDGVPLALIRIPAVAAVSEPPAGRPATLEEVVIGHLAAGRRRSAEAARLASEGAAA